MNGLTLTIERLIVVCIMMVLSSYAFTNFHDAIARAKNAREVLDQRTFATQRFSQGDEKAADLSNPTPTPSPSPGSSNPAASTGFKSGQNFSEPATAAVASAENYSAYWSPTPAALPLPEPERLP